MMPLSHQFAYLLLLALPIACASWTVTHEEVFREPREFCSRMSQDCRAAPVRKFFYLFTCEYCFSHYVTAFFLLITRFTMLYTGWRGYLISWYSLVWIANVYMSVFNRLRLEIKHENVTIATDQVLKARLEEPVSPASAGTADQSHTGPVPAPSPRTAAPAPEKEDPAAAQPHLSLVD